MRITVDTRKVDAQAATWRVLRRLGVYWEELRWAGGEYELRQEVYGRTIPATLRDWFLAAFGQPHQRKHTVRVGALIGTMHAHWSQVGRPCGEVRLVPNLEASIPLMLRVAQSLDAAGVPVRLDVSCRISDETRTMLEEAGR